LSIKMLGLIDELVKDKSQRVAVLGCGSPFRGDDAAGTLIASRLAGLSGRAKAFVGDVAPENLTGEIKAFQPDLVLVFDAIDLGIRPGELRMFSGSEVTGVSFSTHMLPLRIIIEYLEQETEASVVLLAIQIESLEFMADISAAVNDTVDALVDKLGALLG